jgi:hypothetical protein
MTSPKPRSKWWKAWRGKEAFPSNARWKENSP